MTLDEARAISIAKHKYISHSDMQPGWRVIWHTDELWSVNPHTNSMHTYYPSASERGRTDWVVL